MRPALRHAAEGALGGAIGTAFMQLGMRMSSRLPEPLQPPPMQRDPGDYMVARAESLTGRRLSGQLHERAAQGLHWAYGITWPTLLGIGAAIYAERTRRRGLLARLRARPVESPFARPGQALLAGAGLGAAVWAVGYAGWLPRAGLAPPLRRQGASHALSALGTHLVYGALTALPLLLLERRRAR